MGPHGAPSIGRRGGTDGGGGEAALRAGESWGDDGPVGDGGERGVAGLFTVRYGRRGDGLDTQCDTVLFVYLEFLEDSQLERQLVLE